jgi:uncharacterized protein YkwD
MKAITKFSLLLSTVVCASLSSAASFYPQSNPSNEEQYILELINAARANPTAEGNMLASVTDSEILRYYNYYGVDTNTLRSDFSSYSAKPPLAFNPDLETSSREQSIDQATNGFQGHDSSDGTTFDVRISNTGYSWYALGENVFAYVENPFFGHVGLNADWGVPDLDHRANIMNLDPSFPTFKEIGISYVSTSVPNFGPYVITEDFGAPLDQSVAYLVGVVYNDANGNGSYDIGEGLGGVTITTSAGDYYTTTTASGGYVLPLPAGSGTLTITAAGGPLGGVRTQTISYVAGVNVKVDFTTAMPSGGSLPVVKITASNNNLTPGGSPASLKISRSKGDVSQDLQVALNVSGSAIPGVDVTALPTTVTIPAGSASIIIPVQATPAPTAQAANSTPSGIKKIKIQLQDGAGYLVSPVPSKAKASVKIWTAAS